MTRSRLTSCGSRLEEILQGELNQPGRYRVLRDHAEGGGTERRPRIGELRVIQRVVEFRTEGQDGVFAKSSDAESLTQGEIRIELAGTLHDALARGAVAGGPVGPDRGRSADRGGVDPAGQPAARVARR